MWLPVVGSNSSFKALGIRIQSSNEYDHFIKTFEQFIVHLTSFKPHLLLITGDFNARSFSWWSGDVGNIEGTRLGSITSLYGLHQIINEPTSNLPSSSSCIDLIFTNQPNMTTDSGVHLSLHRNCNQQIIFAKANLKIFYPPPYKRRVWDYRNANVEAINSAIESFNWENTFYGKDIHAQVALFNETLLYFFSNFIPNRTKTFTGSDPPWMTEDIKNKIKLKNKFYHEYMRHQTQISSLLKVEDLRNEISNLITKSKEKYYQRINVKLNDPSLSNKTYWSILKTFYNGKKVPIIPPLFIISKFVTDFQ